MTLTRLPSRQLDLGAASFFEALPEDPPANQVTLRAGSYHRGGHDILQNALFPADQPTVGFSVVAPGMQRYDLVAMDTSGSATIVPGYEVTLGSGAFQGAPGWTGTNPGIRIPDGLLPVAYVLVDETASVTVTSSDITAVSAIHNVQRDYDGYLVDKGLFGAAPTGTSDDVSALFAADTRIDSTGATVPDSGGTATQTGFVTSAPLNYVHLLDQNGDEIIHTVTGARVYGRLTEAAGVWTLSYFYIDATGSETATSPDLDSVPAPTDVRLVGTPKIFSRNDPARPLFDSNVARLSDQVVGDIPLATETSPGKVQLAADGDTAAGEAVQGNDSRLGTITSIEDDGSPIGGPFDTLNFIGGAVPTDAGGGVADISVGGIVLQKLRTERTTTTDVSGNVIPTDGTIPQRTEGTQIVTRTITPSSASNRIIVRGFVVFSANAVRDWALCLFSDKALDAIATSAARIDATAGSGYRQMAVEVEFNPADTSLHTFEMRLGPESTLANANLNADNSAAPGVQQYGGTETSWIEVIELTP